MQFFKLEVGDAFKKKQAVYFVKSDEKNKEGRYYMCVAIENQPRYIVTPLLLSIDFEDSRQMARQNNLLLGITDKRVKEILNSSISIHKEIKRLIESSGEL